MKESRSPDEARKILYVITKANWGGAQRYVYDLALGAHAAGHTVAVATGGTGVLTEQLTAAGIRVITLPLRQRRSFLLDLLTFSPLVSLVRLIRTERPDVLHVNSAKAGGLGALAGRLAHVPRIIFTAHGWEFNAPRSALSKVGIRFFSWLTVLLAHTTIAVSHAIRRDTHSWPFVAHKIVVVHLGVACSALRSREEARAALGVAQNATGAIGMISELHPTKRVEDALRAFSLVHTAHPEATLTILGTGIERVALERVRDALALGDTVHFCGFVPEAARLLCAFDVFLHTSQSEALGYAILEAGCASLPVVATRVGGIPEIITTPETGTLVDVRNVAAIAAALTDDLEHPAVAHEKGARLHAVVTRHFGTERMVRDTLAHYH